MRGVQQSIARCDFLKFTDGTCRQTSNGDAIGISGGQLLSTFVGSATVIFDLELRPGTDVTGPVNDLLQIQ